VIIDRIKQFIDYLGVSNNEFTRTVGLSNGFLTSGANNKRSIGSDIIERILCQYPQLDPMWILTGNGSMIISKSVNNVSILEDGENAHKNAHNLVPKQKVHKTLALAEDSAPYNYSRNSANLFIPYLPSRTFSFITTEPDLTQFETYRIPGLRNADFLMPYYGDDMHPTVSAGNIIAGKIVKKAPLYTWGRVHLFELEEVGVIMGRLRPGSEGHTVRCEPENPSFQAIEFPVENIIAIAMLMAVIKIL